MSVAVQQIPTMMMSVAVQQIPTMMSVAVQQIPTMMSVAVQQIPTMMMSVAVQQIPTKMMSVAVQQIPSTNHMRPRRRMQIIAQVMSIPQLLMRSMHRGVRWDGPARFLRGCRRRRTTETERR
jgi:hypothetical protein